jgi:hypothetical protein
MMPQKSEVVVYDIVTLPPAAAVEPAPLPAPVSWLLFRTQR